MMARVKKNDTVMVISGRNSGQQGTVVDIEPRNNRGIVKGVNVVTRHVKAKKQGDIAGIKKEESYISLDRVMPVCSACNKPCRVQIKVTDTGAKARMCHRCKETF